MTDKNCSVCLSRINDELPDVLALGGYGVPRYLCSDCAEKMNIAAKGRDPSAIEAAMDELSSALMRNNPDDRVAVCTMRELFDGYAQRAAKIKRGEWDFDAEEAELENTEEELSELPPELLESEEDRLLDEREAEQSAKFDKVMNWVWAALLVGMIAVIIWRFMF